MYPANNSLNILLCLFNAAFEERRQGGEEPHSVARVYVEWRAERLLDEVSVEIRVNKIFFIANLGLYIWLA